ncbi:MAG: arsenite S-adenosylmethyltransferase, partial [Bacteroidetes bacterium]|nr:arsenite S-adenosylmethyltransferase [Bacteroidota bacterium]
VAGAVQQEEYLQIIKNAGFKNIEIKKTKTIELPDEVLKEYLGDDGIAVLKKSHVGIFSITVTADKN